MEGFYGFTVPNLIQVGAVCSACWAIISGIGAWRREFIGKRKIDLAEQTLASFYEVRDAIMFIRSPFAYTGEGGTRVRGSDETPEAARVLDRGYVVVERYNKRERAFTEFNTLKYKFMASFGHQHEEIFVETTKTVNSVFNASRILAHHYWDTRHDALRGEAAVRHTEEAQRIESILWDFRDKDDKINLKLGEMQTKLEEATKPCFEEEVSLYTALTRKWKLWW